MLGKKIYKRFYHGGGLGVGGGGGVRGMLGEKICKRLCHGWWVRGKRGTNRSTQRPPPPP